MFSLAPQRTVSRVDPTRTVAQIILDGSTTPKISKKELQKKVEAVRRFIDKDKRRQVLQKNEVPLNEGYERVQKVPQIYDKHGNYGSIEKNKYLNGKIGNSVEHGIYDDGHRKWMLDEQLLLVGSDGENNNDSEYEDDSDDIKDGNEKRNEDSEDEKISRKRNKESDDEDETGSKEKNEESEDENETQDKEHNEESEEENIYDQKNDRRKIYDKEANNSEPEEADEDEWDQFLNKKPNVLLVGVFGFPEHKITNKNKNIKHPVITKHKIEPECDDEYDYEELPEQKIINKVDKDKKTKHSEKTKHEIEPDYDDEYDDDYEDENFVNKRPNIYTSVDHRVPFINKRNKQVNNPDEDDWDYEHYAEKKTNVPIVEVHKGSNKDKDKHKKNSYNNFESDSNDSHLQKNPVLSTRVNRGNKHQPAMEHKPYYPQRDATDYEDDEDDDWDENIFGKKELGNAKKGNNSNSRPKIDSYLHDKLDRRSLKEQRTPLKSKSVIKQYIKGNDINNTKDGMVSEIVRERLRREHSSNKTKYAEMRRLKAEEVRQRKSDLEREERRRREGILGEEDEEQENKIRTLERFKREKEMQENLRKKEEIYNIEKSLKVEDEKKIVKKREREEATKKLEEEKRRKINEIKQRQEELIKRQKDERQKAQNSNKKTIQNYIKQPSNTVPTVKQNTNHHQQSSIRLNPQPNSNLRLGQKLNQRSGLNPSPRSQLSPQPSSKPNSSQQPISRPGLSPSPRNQLLPKPSSNPSLQSNLRTGVSPSPRSQLNPQPSPYPNPVRRVNSNSSLNMKLHSLPSYNIQNSRSLDNLVQTNSVAAQSRY